MDYMAKKVGLFYYSIFINVHIIMDLAYVRFKLDIRALYKFCFIYFLISWLTIYVNKNDF